MEQIPLCYKDFWDVFSKGIADTLPPHRSYDCPIDLLPDTTPPRGRVFPLSEPENLALQEYIQENLAKGFIRPSTSPAGAGCFFVPKKDGGLRLCVDYRGLNKITVPNRYPLPLITELFSQIQGAKIFSKLDLRGAYNLVRIRAGDEWKTAFNTKDGHYECLVMPFGLRNAPAVFQNFMNDIFRDMLGRFMLVYLDDILIYSPNLETHQKHVCSVLARLKTHSLFVKPEKCSFHVKQVPFLGYLISDTGLTMDPAKIQAILDWAPPSDLKAVQRFLGFANFYRKFIKNFATIAHPITSLTRKTPTTFKWTTEAQAAFTQLKKAFTSAPILRHPVPELPFIVEVDASEVGVGALLSQKDPVNPPLCLLVSEIFPSRAQL